VVFEPTFPEGSFVDLAVVLHGQAVADFLWRRANGTWESQTISDHIPGGTDNLLAIRPSFAYKRGSAGNERYLDIRSLHVEELDSRRKSSLT
jgi:hypothetical protein